MLSNQGHWTGIRRRATARYPNATLETRWLDEWRDENAYVLLGDPGAGKSWSFKAEAATANASVVTARMIQEDLEPLAEPGLPVFVDALDEVRGGAIPGADALAAIARWIQRGKSRRFRIACREADWRGEADRQLIERVALGGKVTTLHLEPLQPGEILDALRHRAGDVVDPDRFVESATQYGVINLLGNPLILDLMVDAVAENSGNWPETRRAVYDGACRRLAHEESSSHRSRVVFESGQIDRVLDDAGILCAVVLLSGNRAIRISGDAISGDVELPRLPRDLPITNAADTIRSKVFTVSDGQATPRHRTIAEFLAARSISRLVSNGLPLGRVLALLQGFDGKPVEALRGLFAWLAVHLQGDERQHLLRLDPLGFILNGDAASLTRAERVLMLEALSTSAAENQWFRAGQWVDHPFGPLATLDTAEEYRLRLNSNQRDQSHQSFVDCLLDALRYSKERIPSLVPSLAAWVVDGSAFEGVRLGAYAAWKQHCPHDEQPAQIMRWLDGLIADSIPDPDDRLLGRVLRDAYPSLIQSEVLRYLRPKKNRRLVAEFSDFWGYYLIRHTPLSELPALADAWLSRFPEGLPHDWKLDAQRAGDELLATAIENHGDRVSIERLYAWLGIGLDDYDMDRSDDETRKRLEAWFEVRPELTRTLVAHGYASQHPDRHGHKNFWRAEARLRGAARTRDLLVWNMAVAGNSGDIDFVRWVVGRVAGAVVDPPLGLDVPQMDAVVNWAEALAVRHPTAPGLLQECWTVSLDDWRADEYRRKVRHRAEREHERAQRAARFAPVLSKLGLEPLPSGVLNQISLAYEKRFFNIAGETPEERIEDLLGVPQRTVSAVLAAIDSTLEREDLPSPDQVFELEAKNREHLIRLPSLLAAQRASQRNADQWKNWSDELLSKLVAFRLTDGSGDDPDWYKAVSVQRPDLVAPIFVRYANARLRRKGPQFISGLWNLSREADLQRLVELSLPDLLDHFPHRASEGARDELNRSLLAALPRLDAIVAIAIVRGKLNLPGLDPGQRIAWLAALLPFDSSAASDLAQLIGRNPRRAVILGKALRDQGVLGRTSQHIAPAAVERLVVLLAPITPYEPDWPGGFVTDSREREQTVKALLENLGRNPTTEARETLKALVEARVLGQWQGVAEFQMQAQRAVYRETSFHAAEAIEVAHLLSNGEPAQLADLAALVVDHLRAVEKHLRGDPSFQLRQIWRSNGTPHPENWCRDFLVSQLTPMLTRQKVDLQPESMAAASKRMDLRATALPTSGVRLSIPIEVKKDGHKNVWTAWRDQLQKLYSIDPTSRGFGIYLVLWFNHQSTPSPEGFRPSSAGEFAEHLRSRIPEADRAQLTICVMDLSWPAYAKQ